MFDVDELVNEFKFVGIDVSEEIINKCLEVCIDHRIDAEAFVEEWVAFAETNLSGKLQPSLQTVDMMVRKQFVKQEKINNKQEDSDIKVYNPSISTEMKNILNTYNAGNIKAEQNVVKQDHIQNGDSKTSSPAVQKLSGSQSSAAYAKRTDAGTVLLRFGAEHLHDQTKAKPAQNVSVSVELLDTQSVWDAHSSRYMFDTVDVEASALQTRMNRLGQVLITKHNLDEPVDEIVQQGTNIVTTFGRIRSDGDGRLNSSSVLVEKISQNANGYSAIVNLKNIQKYSLFPGQIVAMRTAISPGINRYTLIPEAIFTDATPELPAKLPNIPEPLRIVVACGPFTLSDNLQNQPLDDLIKHVVNNQVNVVILVGPFVDVRHASVSDGTMAETFRCHFESIVDNFMSQLQHLHVQVVLISSGMDAHHFNIYPTPPYDLANKYSNLHIMPDPSVISLNGLIVGLTSVDVLFHLARIELNYSVHNSDRMARFISHILSQQCFYPLYPPQTTPGTKLNVDQGLLEQHAKLPVVPHILILPSNFGYFVKNVNGSVVINPERLAKGYVGGTFACIDVHPVQEGSVTDNITCQIIKI